MMTTKEMLAIVDKMHDQPSPYGIGRIKAEEMEERVNIEELDLSVRTYNRLKRYGINTVDDFIGRMADIRRFAPKAYDEAIGKVMILDEEMRRCGDDR